MKTTTTPLTFGAACPGDALAAAVAKGRSGVIAEISRSGLGTSARRPSAGIRWNLAAAARSDEKFVICNASEWAPGVFKDRAILADHADLVVEGMTIAAFAIGARRGFVWLRAEYAYLAPELERTLVRLRGNGRLGPRIQGRDGFDFDVAVRVAAAGQPHDDNSAVVETLEGRRGEPRGRSGLPVDAVLDGRPTIVDSVETFSWAAYVMANTADWYKTVSQAPWIGRRIVCVSGDCERPGLYELPLETTVTQLLARVGAEGAQAVQLGGPAGRFVPSTGFRKMRVCGDDAAPAAVVVLGPGRDLLAVAGGCLDGFAAGSCGQCTPCREGIGRLREGVDAMSRGRCTEAQTITLKAIGETMQVASRCGHGRSAANAFLSILEGGIDHV